jgi:nicotinamidase-related amidase
MATKEEEKVVVREGDALSVTDMQMDFLPGGSLAVPEGDRIIAPLNRAIALFHGKKRPIFFTRDWHPPDHMSFKAQGGPWPPHCVQNTPGAEFHPRLQIPEGSVVVSKADKKDVEEYSTFYARDGAGRTEKDLLAQQGIRRLFIGGLATDYCVLNTVREARKAGMDVYVLADAVRAVNVNPDDGEKALKEMKEKRAKLITTGNLT